MTLDEALAGLRDAVIPPPPATTLDAVQAQIMQVYADWDASTKDPNAMQALSTRLRDLADATQAAVDEMHRARGRFITATCASLYSMASRATICG